jgi:hypothetical protein
MKRSLLMTLVAGGLACLLLSACGGGSSSKPTPAPTPTLASSALSGLVLPLQTLTVSGIELELDGTVGGPQTRAQVLESSFDTQRDSAELDQYGWRADQTQSFLIPSDPGSGVFLETNTIDLADTSDHAAQALARKFSDLPTDIGKTSTDSSGTTTTLNAASTFTPTGFVGAMGAKGTIETSGSQIYLTAVGFTVGPVFAEAGVASHDQSDQTAAAVDLAHQLQAQIGTVVKS